MGIDSSAVTSSHDYRIAQLEASPGTANLSVGSKTSTTLDIESSTGTNATVPAATTSEAGLLTAADKTKIDGLNQAIILQGAWDASAGTFPASSEAGYAYIVSVAGTVDSIDFNVGDRLLSILDAASTTTYANNWFKDDGTDQVTSVFGRTGAVVAASGDYTASEITNVAAGTIAATDVQAAINELDTEKVPTTRTLTTAADSGLSGGGDLSANRTLVVDINGTTEETTPDFTNDEILMYDASATALRKVKVGNIGLDINGQTAEPDVANDDEIIFYDTSASVTRKTTRGDFINDPVVIKTAGSVTLTSADFEFFVVVESNAAAQTITLPTVVAADVGRRINILNKGSDNMTVSSGSTIVGSTTNEAGKGFTAKVTATGEWTLVGTGTAASPITVSDTASLDLTLASDDVSGVVLPAGVDHDALANFVANEHIDHSAVSITAGTALTGGGDLTATRTLNVDETAIDHDNLSNFVADEHVAHTSVDMTAGTGLTGGGDISATRTFNVDVASGANIAASTANKIVDASAVIDEDNMASDSNQKLPTQQSVKAYVDTAISGVTSEATAVGDTASVDLTLTGTTITADVLPAGVDHDSLNNFVANEHIDHTSVSMATAADSGLTGGGTIAATRNLSVDINGTTAESAVANDDELLIYDTSATALRKTTRADFVNDDVVTKATGSITLTSADFETFIVAETTGASQTITLPDVATADVGRRITIINKGTDDFEIVASGGDFLVGSTINAGGQGFFAKVTADNEWTLVGTGNASRHVIVTTADNGRTNNATPAIDENLQFPVLNGDVWMFEFTLFTNADNAAPDLQMGLTGPAGSTLKAEICRMDNASNVGTLTAIDTTQTAIAQNATTKVYNIAGSIVAGADGNFGLYWAQNTSNANETRILSHSNLIAHRP